MEQAKESSDKWSTFISTNETKQYLFFENQVHSFLAVFILLIQLH